ncbi:MAG TPA: dockerin type I repeat-containing protein [Candidatus Margulisiibacteriota bacterium]|nr:dockerin type I repeat-containing protein [Candidatus Margulisiibacteriota bacterium]
MQTRFSQAQTRRYVVLLLLLAITTLRTALAQVRGDVNCDGQLDSNDLSALIAVLFGDGASDCGAADVNGDGYADAADITALQQALDPPTGPVVTFLGLAGADGRPTTPLGTIGNTPVYFRNTGSGFQLVVEARPGLSGQQPGVVTFDPSRRPDIQIESSAALGDGSPALCEGGVPAINPPDFGPTRAVANALNDLACHFPAPATSPNFSCTQDSFGRPRFMSTDTRTQFCLLIPRDLEFPTGQTTLSVRWRDTASNLGPLQQLILQVDSGPPPATFTASPTVVATPTRTASATITTPPTLTPTTSRVRTPTPTQTTLTTPLATRSPTPSAVITIATPTNRRPTSSATATSTSSAASPTLNAMGSPTPTATRPTGTLTPPPTRTPTTLVLPSASPTRTPTVTRTPTPQPTMTRTPTSTRTRTATRTATLTPVGPSGPVITFFGVTRADDTLVAPSGTTPDGVRIYQRSGGTGFSLVVEGAPGPSGSPVGRSAFAGSATSFPDLQVEVSRPLGNGSKAVCDRSGSMAGGVPAVDPPSFDETPAVVAAVNDLSCRFLNGSDMPVARSRDEACIMFPNGELGFAKQPSTLQFCGFITRFMEFPSGETLVTARLRDQAGNAGAPAQIVISVGP